MRPVYGWGETPHLGIYTVLWCYLPQRNVCRPLQASCSSEAEQLAAEVAAKQAELAQAQAQQAACQEAADGLMRDIAETERRLQVRPSAGNGTGFCSTLLAWSQRQEPQNADCPCVCHCRARSPAIAF